MSTLLAINQIGSLKVYEQRQERYNKEAIEDVYQSKLKSQS